MRVLHIAAIVFSAALLSSCSTLGYYGQAVGGHMDLMRRARPLQQAIDDTSVPQATRTKLRLAADARRYAIARLGLPDNGSYTRYVELPRSAVVWNVTATPAFAIRPLEWCYTLAGCFSYRGYFEREEAQRYADELSAKGYDVMVSPASAYSTLGWFQDPLLSTMLRRSDADLVGTLFHELAHQRLHIKGDSAFNEAFAVAVAEEGVRRWYSDHPEHYAAYRRSLDRTHQIAALLVETRRRLHALYQEPLPAAQKQARKRAELDELLARYEALKQAWDGYRGYDAWIPPEVNNAHLALTATYHELVPAFRALLAQNRGDLAQFYRAASALGALPHPQRHARLAALLDTPERLAAVQGR